MDRERRQGLLRAGFGDAIDLTALSRIRSESGVALRVRSATPGIRMSGLKLRVGTLNEFTGERWLRMENPDTAPRRIARDPRTESFPMQAAGEPRPTAARSYRISMPDLPVRALPLPEGTVAVRASQPAELILGPEGQVLVREDDPPVFVFGADAAEETALGPLSRMGDVTDAHLALPPAVPR